jgi:calcineurin-like phosphoesterase family protein
LKYNDYYVDTDLAKKQGGRVIKLFGNHDLINVVEPMQYFDYHSKFGDLEENMYHGIKRYIFFTTKEGKDLINLT